MEQEVNEQQTTYEREYVARVELGLQKIFGSILALMDKIAELSVEIHSKKRGSKTDLNEHAKMRKEKFDSDETAVRRIRGHGPESEVPDVVVDATKSVHDLIEIKQHAVKEVDDVQVAQVQEQIVEMVKMIPPERLPGHIVEQIADIPVLQITEDTDKSIKIIAGNEERRSAVLCEVIATSGTCAGSSEDKGACPGFTVDVCSADPETDRRGGKMLR